MFGQLPTAGPIRHSAAVRFIHVSDIHHQLDWKRRTWSSSGLQGALGRIELHGFGRLKRFSEAATQWARILEDIELHAPDHVLLTGDLTAMGHPEELEAMHDTLRPLLEARRLTLVPGNHDRYLDARAFERVFSAHLASDLPEYADVHGYPFVKLLGDDVALVGLDSTRVSRLSQYFVGRLGKGQLAALARVLDDPRLSGRTVHVLSHHGPLSKDGPALLKTLHGRSVVLHHGHSHIRTWRPAENERPHLFGGGSSTEPGREGFWLVDVENHRTLEATRLVPGQR